MTRLILGVDGGQTSTSALLASEKGEVLGVGAGGPANHIHQPGGIERMEQSLRDAVLAAFQQAGIVPVSAESACFGMTGGASLVPQIVTAFLQANIVTAYHDVVTALAGASLTKPGIVVIAGTGAIAYGRDEAGREATADGWGYLMGDEGSAYDIGLKVLRAAAQAADKRGTDTLLRHMVPRFLHKIDLAAVRAALYSDQITRADIAGLAWVASCAAEQGDRLAREILAKAGHSLALTANAVIEMLHMGNQNPSVYPTGGVFRSGRWVLETFGASLRQMTPHTEIRMPAFPQVVGSLLLAQQQAGYIIDEGYLERLRQNVPTHLQNKSSTRNCADLST